MNAPVKSFTKYLSLKKAIYEVFLQNNKLLEQFNRDLEEQKKINKKRL